MDNVSWCRQPHTFHTWRNSMQLFFVRLIPRFVRAQLFHPPHICPHNKILLLWKKSISQNVKCSDSLYWRYSDMSMTSRYSFLEIACPCWQRNKQTLQAHVNVSQSCKLSNLQFKLKTNSIFHTCIPTNTEAHKCSFLRATMHRNSFTLSLSNISSHSRLKKCFPMVTGRMDGLHYAWLQTHSARMKGP